MPADRRLARDPDDRVVAGVCAAAGRYTDTDPVLWRVVLAALALAGGVGVGLYLLAWLLIPRTGSTTSWAERQLRRPDRSVNVAGVALLLVIALAVVALLDDGSAAVVVLVVGGLAYLAARDRAATLPADGAPVDGARVDSARVDSAWVPTGPPSQYGVPPVAPPVAAAPIAPRERSLLGAVTVSAATLVVGVLLLLREAGVEGITAPRVLAAALLVVGAGLLVGTWIGRARWLALVGLGLVLALIPAAATDGRLDGGAGERTWVPTAGSALTVYRLGAGEATLDLRRLDPGDLDRLDARVGVGSLVVLVPEDLRVRATADVGLGEIITLDRDLPDGQDREVLGLGPSSGPLLELDLEVGLGEIEVRRVQG